MDEAVESRSGPLKHSIRTRLYLVFSVLLLLVVGLGALGVQRLGEVNGVSEVIRDHWLEDTRILGDLSNYMSDYRTAEATSLLAATGQELAASEQTRASLSATIAKSGRAYQAITQEPAEAALYAQFSAEWATYLGHAARALELARHGRRTEGVAVYMSDSRRAFDLASDTLSHLTERTVSEARSASLAADATYRRARTLIVVAMLLAGALLMGAITFITSSILHPLLDLARRMRALADHDTDSPVPGVERADEMGEMSRSVAVFRDNAVALMQSQRRSIAQAATLEEALESEQRLTTEQRNFVSMTSHEFRTPLTIIDGHAQRLIKMSERIDPSDIAERGARIRSAVKRMTQIMDSLLGASRLLDGQAVFHPSAVDPAAALREACQAHREADPGALILEDFSTLPGRIHGDPNLLFHAFSNLISNAIKFSPAGSPVEVAAREEPGVVVVEVRDRGIGIPARDRQRLFQRYFRGANATGIAGTGVGLHLVQRVVTLHQGEVFAESLEGVGSTFVVRLPTGTQRSIEAQLRERSA